jgi:hypothetical protein
MLLCAALGWPQTKRTIVAKAVQMANELKAPFKGAGGQPGVKWFAFFRKRHTQDFAMRRAHKRKYNQAAAATRANLDSFYALLQELVVTHKLQPDQIWNADESGFSRLGVGKGKVAVPAGARAPPALASDWEQHVTLMAAIRADGLCMPPMLIFKGVEGVVPRDNWLAGTPDGTLYSQTGPCDAL